MGKRREVERRIEALNEIHGIMNSMKNLAMMEVRKLERYHARQQRVVDAIGHALNDVRRHYLPDTPLVDLPPVYLLFGSDRGFCGAYNQQLLALLAQQPGHQQAPLIGVGARLAGPLLRDYPHAVQLPGASVAAEVGAVLATVAATLNRLRRQLGPLRLEVIHFQPDSQDPCCQPVLPPLHNASEQGLAPLVNLAPQQLFGELLEHYIFALTHAWFFAALMSENQRRVQHLNHAGHHLERQVGALGRRRNVLRQEEIIEEIEVILLSAEAVSSPGIRL
jgi:F-type H+-transporting ATPase subunit gamma